MATFPVKYINNNMRGAPQLSGTAGTLIAVLDAFLITGFGQVTALSVTVAGGIATASLQSGQSFDPYCVVWVDGATPAELNGEARVLTSSSSSITFATTAPDGVATGAITIKVAPVGQWEKPFTGTNKAVYRSTDVTGSRFCLWVDDSGTITARVRGFESMTDMNTGTGPFPADAQISGGGYWFKSLLANATAVRYDLVADSRTILVATGPAGTASPIRGFGDMLALSESGDVFSCALSAAPGGVLTVGNTFAAAAFDTQAVASTAIYFARDFSGLGGSVPVGSLPYVGSVSTISGTDSSLGVFPSRIDGALKFSKRYLHAGDGGTPRADVPGLLHIPQSGVLATISPRSILEGSGTLINRRLLALGAVSASVMGTTVNATGISLVDITGPWR